MQNMPISLMILALLAVSVPGAAAAGAKADPLGRVVELMDSLASKIAKEGEAEAKAYNAFVSWCDDASKDRQFSIQTTESKKAKLEATIGKASGDSQSSSSKVEELAASIATDNSDLESATKIREKEAADFSAKEAEFVEVVGTLGRAISVLEREMAKNPASFAQVNAAPGMEGLVKTLSAVVDAAAFSNADKSKLLALVQGEQGTDDEEFGAPAAATYKTHSGSILDVLEDLKEKAEEQLSGLRKAEVNAKHNYSMLKQSLEDQMAADTKSLNEQKSSKAAALETKAAAEGDLAVAVKDLANSKNTLKATNANCMQTAADHEATVKSRNEELQAIAQAKKILEETTSGAGGRAYSMLQLGSGSQLQTRTDLVRAEVLALVKRLAREHHSTALAQLASQVSAVLRFGAGAGAGPFAKVKDLISEMISKLEAQSQSETTEKAYCDEQIAKTEAKKTELEAETSKLSANIDKAAARSAGLKADVKVLQAELAALAKEQAEMDATRQEQSAAYAGAKADLEAGIAGVRKAMGVLREYYGSGAGAASMVQQGTESSGQQPAMPEAHAKAADAGSSIIGILEVVESDFAKSLAEESTQEDDANAEYEKTTQENKVTKTIKDQDVKYQTREFETLDKSIADLSADRESTGAELSAVLEYYTQIKQRCIAKPETYESRKARRQAEIQGLKEALSILQDETAFVQRSRKGSRGQFLGIRGQ